MYSFQIMAFIVITSYKFARIYIYLYMYLYDKTKIPKIIEKTDILYCFFTQITYLLNKTVQFHATRLWFIVMNSCNKTHNNETHCLINALNFIITLTIRMYRHVHVYDINWNCNDFHTSKMIVTLCL